MASREKLRYDAARLRRKGASNRAIGRALGIDRRTAAALLEELDHERDCGPVTKTRAPRLSKLDAYRSVIDDLLARYPDIHVTRVLEELRARGFDGGYTIVRTYVRDARPSPKRERFKEVETAPGRQAQRIFRPTSSTTARRFTHSVSCCPTAALRSSTSVPTNASRRSSGEWSRHSSRLAVCPPRSSSIRCPGS